MTAQNRDGTPHSRVRGSEPCRGDWVRIDGQDDKDRPEDSDRWDRPPAEDQPQEEAGEDRRRDHLSSISHRTTKRDTRAAAGAVSLGAPRLQARLVRQNSVSLEDELDKPGWRRHLHT
jgi:hypothetical protein